MTDEQKQELETFRPVWEHWFNHFYVSNASSVIQLNTVVYSITGINRNLNCSDCVAELIKTARNLWQDHENTHPKS